MKAKIQDGKKSARILMLAVIIGLLAGILDALFGRVLLGITAFREQHAVWLVPFLGVSGVLCIIAYQRYSEESLKGMGLVMKTGFGEEESVPLVLIPLIMVSTWITHLFGGSAGREGVAVQMGAAIANHIGRKKLEKEEEKVLLVTGMAAGFAGLFQTPLTATFFAMEVMVRGVLRYDALLPALTASFVASTTSHVLGLEKFSVAITEGVSFGSVSIMKLILAAVLFGITGGAFAYLLKEAKKFLLKRLPSPVKRIFLVGMFLSVTLLAAHLGRYCGLGTNLIAASVSGKDIYAYDWILKLLFTVVTLAAGYQGGEVTPLFSIGASLGAVLGMAFNLPVPLLAALGYAAVFGAATNTLLAPIFIGIEVFGGAQMLPFAVVCMIAYACNGNQTIYGAQKYYNHQRNQME